MKKIILPLLLLAACGNNVQTPKSNDSIVIKTHQLSLYNISEIKIDCCEYIVVNVGSGVSIIHKANCANDFHRTIK